MKRTGEIITLNVQTIQGAVDAYVQNFVQTGLSASGSDALLLLGAQIEYSSGLVGGATREVVLSRASKTSMPTIFDDDVCFKVAEVTLLTTSGMTYQNKAPFVSLPPQAIVVIEPQVFMQMDSNAATIVQSTQMLMWFERVELTAAEKNTILQSRLNNLLS